MNNNWFTSSSSSSSSSSRTEHDDLKNPTCCYYTSFLPLITIETQQQQQVLTIYEIMVFFHSLLNKASPSVLFFQLHLSWCNQPVDDTAHDLLLQNSIPDFSISVLMISSFHLSSPNLISSQITTIELKVQAGPFLLTTNMIGTPTDFLFLFFGDILQLQNVENNEISTPALTSSSIPKLADDDHPHHVHYLHT
jgi:hypothetical protein